MAKKLISIDDAAAAGRRLPAAVRSELVGTFGRNSLYLRDFLTAGATRAQNRTAYQTAIDAAASAGKALCYDGAFFEFEGAPVKDSAANALHWATGHDTHKVVQKTVAAGGLRLAGQRSRAENLYIDADNTTLNFSSNVDSSQAYWMSFGILIEPTAHDSTVRNIKGGGFMRLVLATSMQPEELISRNNNFSDVTTSTHPQLRNFTLDGAVSDGNWTAFQPLAVDGLTIKRVTGWYQMANDTGADPHLIYMNGISNGDTEADTKLWNLNVTWDDCLSTGSEKAHPYKARGVKGMSISNLRATDCHGLFDLINCHDVTIGEGCTSLRDKMDHAGHSKGSVSLFYVKRATVAPILISFSDTLVNNSPGVGLDRCTDVTVTRPQVIANSTTTYVGSPGSLLKSLGANVRCKVIEPRLINLGAGIQNAIITSEAAGQAGSVTDFEVYDPFTSGTFSNGFGRLVVPGGKFFYHPDRTSGVNRKFRIETSCTYTTIVNLMSPYRGDLDQRAMGWLQGERLVDGSTVATARWANGKTQAFISGGWVGDDKGKITITNSSLVMNAATFDSGDVEFDMGIKVGSSSGRVGVCFRATSATDFLFAVLTATGAVIGRNIGGTVTDLATGTFPVTSGATVRMRVLVYNTTVVVMVNGQMVTSYELTGQETTPFPVTTAVHGLYGQGTSAVWEWPVLRKVA